MRVLLVHPEDSVTEGPWAHAAWDLIVDLGWAGFAQYEVWTDRFGCPVHTLLDFAEWHDDVAWMRDFCGIGNERLLDAEGIDWWAVLAPSSFQELYDFLLLKKVAREVRSPAEIRVTRPHPLAEALGQMMGAKVEPFVVGTEGSIRPRLRRLNGKLRSLTPAQIVQIAFDKWDGDYGVRRYLQGRGRAGGEAKKVLLPSAYRNVSRVVMHYASLLPERDFLLVTTRADGEVRDLPSYVKMKGLAAYAPRPWRKSTEREIALLTEDWQILRKKLYETEPHLPRTVGLFEGFAGLLRNCLRMRDAWGGVFEREEVEAVLCADENNPYTRTPAMLARRRGVRTVYCSHGALDATIRLRGLCSETYLAKGEMESDYMERECGIPRERIFVGGPPGSHIGALAEAGGTHIVFFSEPYELYYGRTAMLYAELLPRLCALARAHGKKVMVKLHPFESLAARSQLVDRVLQERTERPSTQDDRELVEVTAEPLSERLLRKIWFSLTVESSVAVECALAGAPSFLCGWFDLDLYNYGRQYARFGAARTLNEPGEISRIPEMLEGQRLGDEARNRLYRAITREEFDAVLQGRQVVAKET